MGNNIHWMFKNKVENVNTITESSGTSNTNYGTNNINDFDINTSFRSNSAGAGTTTLLFDFGSAVYIDSIIGKQNLPVVGGTMIMRAGTVSNPADVSLAIPLTAKGTAALYTSPNGYRYWELSMAGTAAGGYHELFELFLGKRLELNENPKDNLVITDIEDTNESVTDKGQIFKYHNFSRRLWKLNYPAIPQASFESLLNMRRFVKGSYKPLWFCFDPGSNPEITHFARLKGESFTYSELVSGVAWDISFSIEQEI